MVDATRAMLDEVRPFCEGAGLVVTLWICAARQLFLQRLMSTHFACCILVKQKFPNQLTVAEA